MRLGQFIFGCSGTQLTAEEESFFGHSRPFGFILFGRNIENPEQLRDLCASLRDAVGWHAPILIDQEGGRVARMAAPHWQEVMPALDMAQLPASDRAFWLRGRLLGAQLADVGIDVNCAPVLDVARPDTHAVLLNRCYGYDPATVIRHAEAFSDGQHASGVSGVIKHVPGHGLSLMDSHHDLPTVKDDLQTLERTDFAPFRAFSDYPMGMSAHLVFQALDPELPGTQSKIVIDYIRNTIGFSGFLMSDDISMNALSGPVEQRSSMAIDAGCDCVLHCNGNLQEMVRVADALGDLRDAGMMRAENALAARPKAQNVDISTLWDELAEIIG